MRRPTCACVHPDAETCLRWRCPGANFEPEDHRDHDSERCDCGCHIDDEDGYSAWDDIPTEVKPEDD